MLSQWINQKDKAIQLRKKGDSIRDIELSLSIPRSTLSGWFKNIELSDRHKKNLAKRWRDALVKARRGSVAWHHNQRLANEKNARDEALAVLKRINHKNTDILDLALAMLYWGEGVKRPFGFTVGNSDPNLLNFFIAILKKNYHIPNEKIKCYLHLRADQEPRELKKYWSKALNLSLVNFMSVQIDKRSMGKKTYDSYKGVCVLSMGNVAIQRKIMYLGSEFCNLIIKQGGL